MNDPLEHKIKEATLRVRPGDLAQDVLRELAEQPARADTKQAKSSWPIVLLAALAAAATVLVVWMLRHDTAGSDGKLPHYAADDEPTRDTWVEIPVFARFQSTLYGDMQAMFEGRPVNAEREPPETMILRSAEEAKGLWLTSCSPPGTPMEDAVMLNPFQTVDFERHMVIGMRMCALADWVDGNIFVWKSGAGTLRAQLLVTFFDGPAYPALPRGPYPPNVYMYAFAVVEKTAATVRYETSTITQFGLYSSHYKEWSKDGVWCALADSTVAARWIRSEQEWNDAFTLGPSVADRAQVIPLPQVDFSSQSILLLCPADVCSAELMRTAVGTDHASGGIWLTPCRAQPDGKSGWRFAMHSEDTHPGGEMHRPDMSKYYLPQIFVVEGRKPDAAIELIWRGSDGALRTLGAKPGDTFDTVRGKLKK